MPPPWSTSLAVTLSSTGAWGTCHHCEPPSITPNGSTVNKASNSFALLSASYWSSFSCHFPSEPHFVSVYEIGRFAYFFLRETAVENDCGKMVFSRVARVCKNDMGGRFLLEDTWTTFMKARLNCSRSGEIPFYYNELQSTFYLPEQDLIYGIFTTNVWVMLSIALKQSFSLFGVSFMPPLQMKIFTSISNDLSVTAHILPYVFHVDIDAEQYIHRWQLRVESFSTIVSW